ncbi:MAG: YjgN family protein [Candidatus Methylomirabilales bacterium]
MVIGVKCPKCGLMQMPREACKSCGIPLDGASPRLSPPPAQPLPKTQWSPPEGGADLSQARRLSFHGTGGSLFGIHIVNILLTIITLGVYYFWGKVKTRSYILSQTEFAGDRFAYHGTGKELLIGFLKAVLVFGVPLGLLTAVRDLLDVGVVIKVVAGVLAYGLILVFIPLAMVGARRYRLSRTSWRGIRFSFRGPVMDFIKLFVRDSLLTAITLGLYYPIFETRRYAFMASHSYSGNQKFHFDGRGRDLFGSFVLALLLNLPTLGLYWFWFLAKKQRYFWEHTSFGSASFRYRVTGGRLFLLKLGNLLLLLVTLGFGWPWVMVRNARFVFTYLSLEGPLDLEGIQQEAQVASATGEGLASFLDLDMGFGLG